MAALALVYLKYWTLKLRPLMVYPKLLFPLKSIIKGLPGRNPKLQKPGVCLVTPCFGWLGFGFRV